jgi:hypothetical protein
MAARGATAGGRVEADEAADIVLIRQRDRVAVL